MITKKLSLFIVDDDPDDRRLFIDAVREINPEIECISASDGLQALELLRAATTLPDMIFLDLRMPRFSGKKCLAEMKLDLRFKNIPVVIFTTSREVQESKELKEMGAVYFISKPSEPEEVYYLVSFAIEEQMNAKIKSSENPANRRTWPGDSSSYN